ncbi:MAG: phage major capsid protein, partial [Oscillospiraceae bacterium]|nr:phage major capsid protein [Oscillospiraceae bacterium]MDY6208810.1 phage major capsid protein [Oscillospiraceae bacterium]
TQSIGTITLYGCELARSITVSWKLKAMSVSEFIPYIRAKLSSKMGQALGYGVFNGRGISAESTWKPEPIGVITELLKSENASQVIELTNPTAEQLIAGFARANAAIEPYYEDGSAYYVNSKTLWSRIAPICDSTGRPIFTVNSDVQSSIVGYIYGKPVKRDSGVPDDRIVLSNAKEGYMVNVNQQITLSQQDNGKARTTDYNAYGIFDGCPVSAKAHSLIKLTYTG